MTQNIVILDPTAAHAPAARQGSWRLDGLQGKVVGFLDNAKPCLLYTSDAADEL